MNMSDPETLEMIKLLLEKPIMYNPIFKLITKHTGAALFLTQAWYHSNKASEKDGWFYRTIAEWELQTGLSRHEQDTARAILGPKTSENPKGLGLIEIKLRGVPPMLYYRVNIPTLLEALQFAVKRQIEYVEYQQDKLLKSGKLICRKASNLNNESLINTLTNINEKKQKFSTWQETPTEYHSYFYVCIGQPINLNFSTPKRIEKAVETFAEWISVGYKPEDVLRAAQAIRAEGKMDIASPKSITWKMDALAGSASARRATPAILATDDPLEARYREMEVAA